MDGCLLTRVGRVTFWLLEGGRVSSRLSDLQNVRNSGHMTRPASFYGRDLGAS